MREPDLLTTREVAAILRVDPGTVKRWLAQGVLGSVKLGRHRRVTRAQLEAFFDRLEREGSVPPAWPHSHDAAARRKGSTP